MSRTTSLNGSEPILYTADVQLVVSLALCPHTRTQSRIRAGQLSIQYSHPAVEILAHGRQGDRSIRVFHLRSERQRQIMKRTFQISIVFRTTPFTLITPLNHTITSVVKLPGAGVGNGGSGGGGAITHPLKIHPLHSRATETKTV
jgi:hypothetical protein